MDEGPWLSRARRRIRTYVGDANDGIVSTAGLLEGFSGAGASEATLLLAAVAATIAGALALAGSTIDGLTSEREEQLTLIEKERRELAERPADELAELAGYYEGTGAGPAGCRAAQRGRPADRAARDRVRDPRGDAAPRAAAGRAGLGRRVHHGLDHPAAHPRAVRRAVGVVGLLRRATRASRARSCAP